ncbi:MAG: NAD(P)-dependent oxidoreductase [Anaerolineales bacterium]|jgi:phosphoglycerate dehydrogenase-like enzyme
MKILFLGVEGSLSPWYDDFLEAISGRYPVTLFDPTQPIAEQFKGVEVVVAQSTSFGTHKMIDAAASARVKLWQVYTTGLDKVDVAYYQKKGVPLANTPGQFSAVGLAEHALFLMLCFTKNLAASQKNARSKIWNLPVNEELEGKTLGIIGLGSSGRELARLTHALKMKVIAVDIADIPLAIRHEFGVELLGGPEHLDQLLTAADYVSIHTPLTSDTQHMIDARALQLMKPTAVLINVARGEIVDQAALIEALQTGQIKGAGLDTCAGEPLEPDHPLLRLDNVIVTPHVAGVTTGTSRRRAHAAAENIERLAGNLPLQHLVTASG